MSKVRFGVIGAGFIGKVHLESLGKISEAEVVAVCDIVKEVANEAAKKYSVPKVYYDYRELLKDRDIDAVIIATPPHIHVKQLVDALEHGKHVLVEKPLATTLEDARKALDAVAKHRDLKVMVGFCLRFHKLFKDIKRMIEGGELGDPVLLWHIAIGGLAVRGWMKRFSESGGMIVENAIHILDLYRWFAGDVELVSATARKVRSDLDYEDNFAIIMRHCKGCISAIAYSWSSKFSWRSWGGIFTNGSLAAVGYLNPKYKVCTGNDCREEEFTEDAMHMYVEELKYFINAILRDKEIEEASVHDGFESLKIALAVYEAASKGCPVRVR